MSVHALPLPAQVHPADTTAPMPAWFLDAEPDDLAPFPNTDGSQPCAQTNPDAWFPDQGDTAEFARRMCSSCKFESACLAYALERPSLFGVWGGTTAHERQVLRRDGTA